MNNLISPFWDDQCTGPCTGVTGTTYGIFTSTSGVSPNRIFNIEWRAAYYNSGGTGIPLNYEIRLYETSGQIDFVYGVLNGTGNSATVGLQKGTGAAFAQFSCNTASLSNGLKISWTLQACGTPSPTPTATATATASPTPTATFTPTPTATATVHRRQRQRQRHHLARLTPTPSRPAASSRGRSIPATTAMTSARSLPSHSPTRSMIRVSPPRPLAPTAT